MYLQKQWYAVHTRPGLERKVTGLLARKNIEHFFPVNKIVQQEARKKVITEEALINSFVFIRISKSQQQEIRKIEDIVNFVYWLTEPAVIKNDDIDALKMFLLNYNNVKVEKLVITANTQSKAADGSCLLKDKEPEERKDLARVLLPSLGYSLTADVPKAHPEKTRPEYRIRNKYVKFLRLYKSV